MANKYFGSVESKPTKPKNGNGFFRRILLLLVGIFSGRRYQKADCILTKAEINFYYQFISCLQNEELLLMKVRMLDIVIPFKKRGIGHKKTLYELMPKHADFVIVDRKTLQVKAVIELDDSSHNSKAAVKNDQMKNKAYRQAGIPIVRVIAKRKYNLTDIRSRLDYEISKL